MKITKVYTRTGDKGMTSLVGGVRIKKSDIRLEAYGTVDELSANLGMLVSMMKEGDERSLLIRVQNNLFNVCTHLATDQSRTPLYPSAHLAEGEIELLEERIDNLMKDLPERQGFILPGGVTAACQAHITGLPDSTRHAYIYVTNSEQHAEAAWTAISNGELTIDMPAESFISVMGTAE